MMNLVVEAGNGKPELMVVLNPKADPPKARHFAVNTLPGPIEYCAVDWDRKTVTLSPEYAEGQRALLLNRIQGDAEALLSKRSPLDEVGYQAVSWFKTTNSPDLGDLIDEEIAITGESLEAHIDRTWADYSAWLHKGMAIRILLMKAQKAIQDADSLESATAEAGKFAGEMRKL